MQWRKKYIMLSVFPFCYLATPRIGRNQNGKAKLYFIGKKLIDETKVEKRHKSKGGMVREKTEPLL